MKNAPTPIAADDIDSVIQTIRGQKVIFDADLARIYGVPTKRLNEQVKRNVERFPPDFMFQLTRDEWLSLQMQLIDTGNVDGNRSQIATGSAKHRDPRLLPFAFTENGAIMAANVLNSLQAVRMSVFVVRAFVKMREVLAGTRELAAELRKLEAKLTARLDIHETAIVDVLQRLMDILNPPPPPPDPPGRQIGFHARPDEQKPGAAKERSGQSAVQKLRRRTREGEESRTRHRRRVVQDVGEEN